MKKTTINRLFQGLPSYFGGKRKLASWIFGSLNQVIPRKEWSNLVFLDAFLGGGSISLSAKAYGFQQVLANDWSQRSQIIGEAILSNPGRTLSKQALLPLLTEQSESGWIEQTYTPSVFSTRHAQTLDRLQSLMNQCQDATQQSLLRLLFWHLASLFVCFPTSLGTSNRPYAEALDGLTDGSKLNPKRFTDGSFKRLCQPIWPQVEAIRRHINQSIFAGSPVSLFAEDASSFISKSQGQVLYLDPPYADTVSYEKANRVLDHLLFPSENDHPKVVSPFSQDLSALDPLLEASRHIPLWLLSYGSKTVSADALKEQVRCHVPNWEVNVLSRRYTHMAHVSKDQTHHELLVIARKKGL